MKVVESPKTVLVVDDEPLYLDSTLKILQPLGYQVTTALGGAAALTQLRQNAFDVVLLDLMMPKISGQNVLDAIVKQWSETAVVVVSATDSVTAATKAVLNGANDFLRKPYSVEDLLLCIRRATWNRDLKLENHRVLTQLRASEHRHRFVLDHSPDLIFSLDRETRFTYANESFQTLLGYHPKDLLGLPLHTLVGKTDRNLLQEVFHGIGQQWTEKTLEVELNTLGPADSGDDGTRLIPFEIKISADIWPNGADNLSIHCVGRNLTARRESERHIRQLAYYDSLTGLPNRQLFNDRIDQAIKRAQRDKHSLGLLFLDLDNFKFINDTLGHSIGDQTLREVAGRLKTLIRKVDSIARMGGDEFTVILDPLHQPSDAGLVAHKLVQSFDKPFCADQHVLHTGVSIGISIFPQDGETPEELVKNADLAMYRAKQRGAHNYQFYTADQTQWMMNRMRMEHRLREAIGSQRLLLYYQPQFTLEDGNLAGIEALVRWHDPIDGLIEPQRFLPLAEERGLIFPLGDWVLNQACLQAKQWQKRGIPFRRIAINLSTKQLMQEDLTDRIETCLERTGLDPQALELEVTESIFIESRQSAVRTLEKLRGMGISLAIDDFGTGFSSLSMLKHLPINKLKIDRTFIKDISTDSNDQTIVQAILAMGKSLDMEVLAEGVETNDQKEFLRGAGCREAQGFLFSHPLPHQELSQFMRPGPLKMH
jgi:diguanylate cyclase (GGDEF)-like protein/PAS domain S-box-containing protein